jgi:hypothetical protein
VSTFWRAIHFFAEIAAVLGAVLLLVAVLLWLWKGRSAPSLVSTCGALLVAAAQYLHHPIPYWRPAVHSHLLFFVYGYGLEFGGLLVAAGLVWHFAGLERRT